MTAPRAGSAHINLQAIRLAHAIRAGASRTLERKGRQVFRGQITAMDPLRVTLLGVDLTLTEAEVIFGQDVERYDVSEGLQVGDVLALNHMEANEWVAVTVLSDTAIWPIEAPGDPK